MVDIGTIIYNLIYFIFRNISKFTYLTIKFFQKYNYLQEHFFFISHK